jgi:hypothetical protein
MFLITAPFKLILGLILSPFLIAIVVWIATGSRREGFLVALVIYSVWGIFRLITRLLGSATPGSFLYFIFNSIHSVLFIVSLLVYWSTYLFMWGNNFELGQTFAILK